MKHLHFLFFFSMLFVSGIICAKDTLRISTITELESFARNVNKGKNFRNKVVVLVNDIFVNDTAGWKQWENRAVNKRQWIPIGTWRYPFKGIFDGQGYAVYGLYINRGTDGFFCGLFGQVQSPAVIRNVSVKASYIKGCRYAGGIAGVVYKEGWRNQFARKIVVTDSVVIQRCSNEGNVTVTRRTAGGIVGLVAGAAFGILDCENSGQVRGKHEIGGIVGECYAREVRNCANRGGVEGITQVGGIAGFMALLEKNGIEVVNNYNTGHVRARQYGGGIVGELSMGIFTGWFLVGISTARSVTFDNCYNAGIVDCDYFASADRLVGRWNNLNGSSILMFRDSRNYSIEAAEAPFNRQTADYRPSPGVVMTFREEEMKSPFFVKRLNDFSIRNPQRYSTWALDSLYTNNGFPILKFTN